MKPLLRPLLAVLPLITLLAAGCGDGGGGNSFPDDALGLNGVVTPIVSAEVWYSDGYRWLDFTDEDGYVVSFEFSGQGDPLVLAYEVPQGDWGGFDPELTQIAVYDPSIPEWRTYESGAAYSGGLSVGGTPPTSLFMDADFVFSSGGADDLRVRYSGPYTYDAD